jgi:hypothetical protein
MIYSPLNVNYNIITLATHTIQRNTEHQKRIISYGLKSSKSKEHMYICKERGQSVHYKLYMILTILETVWYAFKLLVQEFYI